MSRLASCFETLRSAGKKALIPFITAGDPKPEVTVELMRELVDSGADIIELGVPFSDPMADGPVIQAADERALAHHVSLQDVIGMTAEFRAENQDTPIVLMGYLNPIEIMGYAKFAEAAAQAGVDGVLVVDMPPEEAGEFAPLLRAQELDVIYLVSPTTDRARIELINQNASGYLYYVSLKGVTGANILDIEKVSEKLNEIREISDLPLAVGFGIKDGETASAVAAIADAVVVGSALVRQIEAKPSDIPAIKQGIAGLMREMRSMMDGDERSVA